jgi:translation initiation factor IF-2
MAKKRISELSGELNVSNKEIIDFLNAHNVEVSSHMNSVDEDAIKMVNEHFGKKKATPARSEIKSAPSGNAPTGQKPVRRTNDVQGAPRKMLSGPEEKRQLMQQQNQRRQMADGPRNGQPVRRMLDGPEERRQMQQGQKRQMLNGPQDRRSSFAGQRNQRPGAPRTNGPRTINGVVISSDDGDNRLIHGTFRSEEELEALKREKIKENQARREAEKVKAAKKAAEDEAKANELAAKARKEAADIEKNIEEQKAVEAEKNRAEKAAEAAKEEEAAKAAATTPSSTDAPVDNKNEGEEKPEKVFKTLNNPVRPNIIKRAGADSVNRTNMGEKRNDRSQNGERRSINNENRPDRRNEGRDTASRNQDRQNGPRNNNRPTSDRNHFQKVESKYDGNNRGHSNLFENKNQRSYGASAVAGGARDNNGGNRGRSSGFSTRPQGGFGGGKDEDESRPVSHARDPKKRSNSPEIAESMKQQTNRRNDKSKDREKANKRFDDYDELQGGKKGKIKDPNRAGAFHKPEPVKVQVEEDAIKTISIPDVLTIQELADKMKIKGADIVKKLFLSGKICSVNSDITFEEAENIALEYEIIAEHEEKVDMVAELLKEDEEDENKMVKRPPVVCVMGHVDHGKTSLLDAIRTTNVTSREAGGITQHIGAYMVEINGQKITFLDTPGHEAFTAMRMRGANSTDIAVLVVAADDGVMPQTIEAINHAKAAGVEIIVAINKIDKPTANIERVKRELTEYGLVSEEWGGSTTFVPVSAKTHEGIEQLLEMIILTADVLELKANPDRQARGIVVEAQLDKGRGPVATVLVQKGTLKIGDNVVIGSAMGKVRALINDKHEKVKMATPSMPVEILGLNSVPDAGEVVVATASDKEAKAIANAYIAQNKEKLIAETKAKLSLDGLFSQIQAGNVKELNVIVKADVQGSVEAIKQSLIKLSNEEVAVRIIHSGVGAVNESDATLAGASNAIIIAFNVKADNTAKDICDREKIDLRNYSVIYDAIDDVESAMKGMLDPVFEEQIIAHAEVRQTFKASQVGIIAGSFVLDGKIVRGCKARISRGGNQIFDGNLASLKRFKDDVKEVNAGYECGLVFEKFSDLLEGDQIELYQMVEVPRK